jgi:Mg-chelatase subunit ChlD
LKFKIANKRMVSLTILITFMISIIGIGSYVNAGTDLMNVSRDVSVSNVKSGDTFDVKYTITPKSIVASSQDNNKQKEIVFVMDTSGSMNWVVGENRDPYYGEKSRLDIMKSVANNFIGKFNDGKNKARISLIEYNSYASNITDNFININSNNINKLTGQNGYINNLKAGGSTNIGDGLRKAYYELSNNAQGQEKYIVLMTDGEAEAYSHDDNGSYYMSNGYSYQYDSTSWKTDWLGNIDFNRNPDPDNREKSMEYAKKVASELIANSTDKPNINTFVIGFGSGSDGDKNKQIADAAKGTYFQAQDENTINSVYDKIQKIIDTNVSGKVHLEENISSNLEVVEVKNKGLPQEYKIDNNKLVIDVNNYYTLTNGNYYSDPIEFTVKYKVKDNNNNICKLGEGGNSSFVQLDALGQVDKKYLEEKIIVGSSNVADSLVDINRTVSVSSVKAGDTFEVKYTITPKPIVASSQDNNKQKEIVFVMDTSGSMDWVVGENRDPYYGEKSRLDIMKSVANGFINKFNDGKNKASISLIEYNYYASTITNGFVDINSNNINSLTGQKGYIKKLDAGGSTNIGDGLRRAYYTLSSNADNEKDKYIVLMTDGNAEAYSGDNNKNYYMDDGIYYGDNYYSDNDYKYYYTGWKTDRSGNIDFNQTPYPDYREDSMKYAKKVASEKIANSNINTFVIGFGSGANGDKNKQIAESAKGTYFQAQDENTINAIYDKIQKIIDTNVSGKVHLEESISSNLEVVDVKNNNLPQEYKIDNNKLVMDVNNYYTLTNGSYCSDPIEFTVKYKVKDNNNNNNICKLGEGGNTSFVQLDVLGKTDKKYLEEKIIDNLVVNSTIQEHGIYHRSDNTIDASNLNVIDKVPTELAMIVDVKSSNLVIDWNIDKTNISDSQIIFKKYKIINGSIDMNHPEQLNLDISTKNSGTISNTTGFNMESGSKYIIIYTITPEKKSGNNINIGASIEGTSNSKPLNLTIKGLPDLF